MRYTVFLVALAAGAAATSISVARDVRDTGTATISARARIETVFLPRAAPDTVQETKVDISAALYAMKHTVFEAEDWGDIPKLGLSVQNMAPFGNRWSGDKQIFWNPVGKSFYWDFKAPSGKVMSLDLTSAPDYGVMKIALLCYKKQGLYNAFYHVVGKAARTHDGYAATVTRKRVSIPLQAGCAFADFYRLFFALNASSGNRRLGGIDRIVVAK